MASLPPTPPKVRVSVALPPGVAPQDGATKDEPRPHKEVGKGAKLEDSNMANYGGDAHKALMLQKAQNESEYTGAGEEEGVEVWRAENRKVGEWGVRRNSVRGGAKFGQFFDGDSYIVLESRLVEEKLVHDVYYWLGENSTTDERGVVAMKTVELDDLLGGAPIQHRVVQGGEGRHFKGLFPGKRLTIMKGGIKSGFNTVKGGAGSRHAEQVLLWCVQGRLGRGKFMHLQLPLEAQYVNDENVFVLTRLGGKTGSIIQWNGKKSTGAEKALGAQLVSKFRAQRGCTHARRRVVDGDDDKEFFSALKGGYAAKSEKQMFDLDGDGVVTEADSNDAIVAKAIKEMRLVNMWRVKLSGIEDASLEPEDIELIHAGPINKDMLTSDGIYFVGTIPSFMIVYFGKDVPKRYRSLTMRALETWMAREKLNNLKVTRLVEPCCAGCECGCARHRKQLKRMLGVDFA